MFSSPQIASTEESLVKAAHALRSLQNAFVPINKLLPKILVHICTLFPASEAKSDFAHTCAQVCRYWRNTLLGSPSLWNEIFVEDPLHVDVHLARSGEVPLKVYFCGQSSLDQFCQKVIPHLDRVRFFYLLLHKENHKQISGLLETSGRAISLCEFRFAVGSPGLSLSASVMEKISYFAANITILTLQNVDIHLSSLTFPRLLQFCLVTQKGYKVPRVPDVIGFLRGSPLLKNLDLRNARCSYTDEADNHIEPVDLQHLEHASLRGRPSPSHHPLPYIEVDLLPYLRIPPAGRCRININPPNRTLPGNTNYLLTLIHTWGFISGPGGGFGGGARLTHFQFYIKECLGALTGCLRVEKDEICG